MVDYTPIFSKHGLPVENGFVNTPCVDAMLDFDRIDHARGACDEATCYWCDDVFRIGMSRSRPKVESPRNYRRKQYKTKRRKQ